MNGNAIDPYVVGWPVIFWINCYLFKFVKCFQPINYSKIIKTYTSSAIVYFIELLFTYLPNNVYFKSKCGWGPYVMKN